MAVTFCLLYRSLSYSCRLQSTYRILLSSTICSLRSFCELVTLVGPPSSPCLRNINPSWNKTRQSNITRTNTNTSRRTDGRTNKLPYFTSPNFKPSSLPYERNTYLLSSSRILLECLVFQNVVVDTRQFAFIVFTCMFMDCRNCYHWKNGHLRMKKLSQQRRPQRIEGTTYKWTLKKRTSLSKQTIHRTIHSSGHIHRWGKMITSNTNQND